MPRRKILKKKRKKTRRYRKKSLKKNMRLSRKKTFKKKRRNKAMKGGSMAGAFFQFLADVYSEDKQKKSIEDSEEKRIRADEQKLRKEKVKMEMKRMRKEFEDKREKKEDAEISALIDDSEEASKYVSIVREDESDETSRGKQLSESTPDNVILEETQQTGGKKKKRKKRKKRKRTFKKGKVVSLF